MSDNSNSTGSSGSSTNSWTLLSPEEAAVESVGPVDDGTESLGDVPSLSEEAAGAAVEFKPSDISVETVLSEEGHQICQETSPDSSEGPIPSSPGRMSPLSHSALDPLDLDLESQPPVIHEIDTSSPSDNELLGALPFVTTIVPLDIPASELSPLESEESCSALPMSEIPVSTDLVFDTPTDTEPIPASRAAENPEFNIPTETLTATGPPSHVESEIMFVPESTELPKPVSERLVAEHSTDQSPAPDTIGSVEAEEEAVVENEGTEPSETVFQDQREEEEETSPPFDLGDSSSFDDGVRRRNVSSPETPRSRTSDEEEEEEEVEFKMAEKKEDKPWFSLNKCIVGALILLFLGSLFLSGDFDTSELSDGEPNQDWLSSDPQDMKVLLDKLTQENQQIALLEAQLQSQKEELDAALKAVAANGDDSVKADLEKENAKLKDELSSLPELKTELESLRTRVTELNQLTADQEMSLATPSSVPQHSDEDGQSTQKAAGPERKKPTNDEARLKEELQRQKFLLDESRKRLDGMKRHGGDKKQVRDSLKEIQQKLSEQVERWGKKKPEESKWKGYKGNERDHWKKEGRGEKEWKNRKEGGWKEKEEKKAKDWKSQNQNSHKDTWRKHQDDWERKKDERRTDREERRKEKPWHNQHNKNSHSHHHQHQPQQPHQHNQYDFWRDQEQKLQRNIRPQLGCSSVEDCANKEGLYPVELPEFEELLEGYLSKLEGSSSDSKNKIRKLTADFFEDGVFIHDRVLFSDFAEDVADILEDMVDVLEGTGQKSDDSLEEEMEEFEREALWKFAATV